MRTALVAIALAVILFAGAAYLFVSPSSQLAAASAPSSAQASSIIFDTSRIVDLLRQLLTLQARVAPGVTVPFATTTPATKTATTTASAPAKKPAAAATPPAPVTPQQTPTERALGLVLPNLRSALVNIVCLPTTNPSALKGISGSGIIIDPHGIVLTVAHVAQYELLAQARPDLMGCFVRAGSPASFAYKAKPIYLSSNWVAQNPQTISTADPRGTGENDFALLAITSSDTSLPLPSSFPYVPLSPTVANVGDPVVIGSYGAEFLTSARIRSDLYPTLVFGSVHDHFTFTSTTIDLLSLGGGAAAQQGSSGGGVMNQNGQLVALITTSSSGSDLASRDLHAITNTYLLRAFKQESGFDLNSYITSATPAVLVNTYSSKASQLANALIKANDLK